MRVFSGIDIGSCTTKAVVIDEEGTVVGSDVRRSGVDYQKTAREVLNKALGGNQQDSMPIVSTGYGRHSIDFADDTKTEIACHARGGFAHVHKALILVDIGGQDNKVIKLDEKGSRLEFQMNRKCAAGTGAFIEEIAARMDLPLGSLDKMARNAKERFKIGSYCTVFASTELLAHIRAGASPEELVRGVFESVVDRVMEMAPLEGTVLLCGGVVAYHPIVADIFQDRISGEVVVAPNPQFTGAYGAALFARKLAGLGG